MSKTSGIHRTGEVNEGQSLARGFGEEAENGQVDESRVEKRLGDEERKKNVRKTSEIDQTGEVDESEELVRSRHPKKATGRDQNRLI